jgi:hypothetical protein
MGNGEIKSSYFLTIILHLCVLGWLNQESRDEEHAAYASHIQNPCNICFKAKLIWQDSSTIKNLKCDGYSIQI